MNAAKAIEQAMVAVIRQFAEIGNIELRAWQALKESAVNSNLERKLPFVDVRCSPPVTDAGGVTLHGRVQILCATEGNDDKDHTRITGIYEAIQGVCDDLYSQALNNVAGTTENAIGVFDASLAENAPTISRGGFTFSEGVGPMDEDGVNAIGVSLSVHYSRSGF
jgi:hypothetical protein